MAVGAAGSALTGYEANKNQGDVIRARNAATEAELARQKVYGDKSRGVFDTTLSGFAPEAQTQQLADAQTRTGAAISSNAPTNVGTISTGNGPAVVGDRESSTLAKVFERNAGLDASLGKLKGYDANSLENGLRLSQSGRDIDMIGDFAKTSAGVNAVEQRAAENNTRRPPSMLGQLLQTAGQVGSFYGGKGTSIFSTPGRAAAPNFAPMTSAGAIY